MQWIYSTPQLIMTVHLYSSTPHWVNTNTYYEALEVEISPGLNLVSLLFPPRILCLGVHALIFRSLTRELGAEEEEIAETQKTRRS